MHGLVRMLFGEGDQLDVLQMSMRSGVVFALALAMIRISGRRSFGQRRPFDACATVLERDGVVTVDLARDAGQ